MLTRGQHLNTSKLVCVCSTAVERTIPWSNCMLGKLRNEETTRSRFCGIGVGCRGITALEGKVIAAAGKLEKNGDILTPWANKMLERSMGQVASVKLDEGVIINPAEEVSVVEEMRPNEEDARYHVNLEKRTCGCTHWQSVGIACKHAVAVWEMYQSQLKATGEEISQAQHNAARLRPDTTRHLSDSSGPGTHL